MIKMDARLPESLNGKKPGPDLNWQEMPNIGNTLKNKENKINCHDS